VEYAEGDEVPEGAFALAGHRETLQAVNKLPKKVQASLAIAALLLLYAASYAVLSLYGDRYWSQSGKLRTASGWSISDVERWHPAIAYWEPFRDIFGRDISRANLLGRLYSPLIRLDRAWIHPDVWLFPASAARNASTTHPA
jgi:hypothetical protein